MFLIFYVWGQFEPPSIFLTSLKKLFYLVSYGYCRIFQMFLIIMGLNGKKMQSTFFQFSPVPNFQYKMCCVGFFWPSVQ